MLRRLGCLFSHQDVAQSFNYACIPIASNLSSRVKMQIALTWLGDESVTLSASLEDLVYSVRTTQLHSIVTTQTMATENLPTNVLEMRSMMENKENASIKALGLPDERIKESYHDVPLSDGHHVRAKVFSPKGKASSSRPLILLFHGGGFSFGTCEQCTRPVREFALEFDVVVVSTGQEYLDL